MTETPSSTSISTKLDRIATLAREAPDMALTTLAHHIDIDWLREAYARTRKDGATGVDGQTAAEYAAHQEDNLRSLLDRAKSGTYRAPPVRRVHIPKGDGSQTRPIGMPTFEDKVLQRAVAMVLEAVYEEDFLDCSYGFRPGRSAHQALERLQHEAVCMAGGWVLEVDISKFFDALDHADLREILHHTLAAAHVPTHLMDARRVRCSCSHQTRQRARRALNSRESCEPRPARLGMRHPAHAKSRLRVRVRPRSRRVPGLDRLANRRRRGLASEARAVGMLCFSHGTRRRCPGEASWSAHRARRGGR